MDYRMGNRQGGPMKKEEVFIMNFAGKIIEWTGVGGVVFTLLFDKIARGVLPTFGWLQVSGIIIFTMLALFGVIVDRFLQTVKDLLK